MRLIPAGVVLGIGLGAFIDGIALHQIMRWHNMLSAVVPPVTLDTMHVNMRWDGIFHLLAWGITFAGVWMLWAEGRSRASAPHVFIGQLLLGWGAFNLVEGVLDHHVLGLHHVRDMPVHIPAYDWAFLLGGGVLLLVVGWALARRTAPA
jgi:uncharacterized membrane protein